MAQFTQLIFPFSLLVLLSFLPLLSGGDLGKELQKFENLSLEKTDFHHSAQQKEMLEILQARAFYSLVLEPGSGPREEAMEDLVESVKNSRFTPLYYHLTRDLLTGVQFNLYHRPGSSELENLKNQVLELLKAIQSDTLIDGIPSQSELIINRGDFWTTFDKVQLEVKVSSPKDKVIEMAFSDDGVVFKPFQPFSPLVQDYPLSIGEGHKKIWVIFRTDHGKVGGMAFDSIDFDRSPPTGELTINQGENLVTKHQITLNLQAQDAFPDGILMQIKTTEGEENPPFIPFRNVLESYLLGLSGLKKVSLVLKDRFGQASPPIEKFVTLRF